MEVGLVDRSRVAPRYEQLSRPDVLAAMRRVFRRVNRGMLLLWRLGLGWAGGIWPRGFGRLMVIEHVGRRSGTCYRTPVNYTRADDGLYCVAAFGLDTDWYRNLVVCPTIAVWLPSGRWEARAEDATDDDRRLELIRRVLVDSGFAAPMFGLHPSRMTDVELAAVTSAYRLVRITPSRPAPSREGPGDLTWIWFLLGGGGVAWLTARSLSRRGSTG